MTVQQEAIRMINSMPDDTVSVLVEFLKRMMDNEGHSEGHRVAGICGFTRPGGSWE